MESKDVKSATKEELEEALKKADMKWVPFYKSDTFIRFLGATMFRQSKAEVLAWYEKIPEEDRHLMREFIRHHINMLGYWKSLGIDDMMPLYARGTQEEIRARNADMRAELASRAALGDYGRKGGNDDA